jgi:alginate O-acetyltransferase complex protein AlgJ
MAAAAPGSAGPRGQAPTETAVDEKTLSWLQEPKLQWASPQQMEAIRQSLPAKSAPVARLGKDGWLFFQRDKIATVAPADKYLSGADYIIDAQKQLAQAKVDYIFLLIPENSTIYPEKIYPGLELNADGLPPRVDAGRSAFLEHLAKAGVTAPDLLPAFMAARRMDGVFSPRQRYDTHWSAVGPVIAAQVLAKDIRQRQWYKDAPKVGELKAKWLQATSSVGGDMVKMAAKLGDDTNSLQPYQAMYRCIEGYTNEPANSTIVICGDSNTYNPKTVGGGKSEVYLAAQLAYELGVKVGWVAGMGSRDLRKVAELAHGQPDAFRKNVKLVVHLSTNRGFGDPVGELRAIALTPAKSGTAASRPASRPAERLVVQATIDEVSTLRKKEELAPYKSSLLYIRYKVDKVVSGSYQGETIIGVTWGYQNERPTAMATMKKGKYELTLEPLDAHKEVSTYGADQDAYEDMAMEPYWIVSSVKR